MVLWAVFHCHIICRFQHLLRRQPGPDIQCTNTNTTPTCHIITSYHIMETFYLTDYRRPHHTSHMFTTFRHIFYVRCLCFTHFYLSDKIILKFCWHFSGWYISYPGRYHFNKPVGSKQLRIILIIDVLRLTRWVTKYLSMSLYFRL